MPSADATKVLARDFEWVINTGTIAVPVWTKISGLNTFSFEPSKSDADTTDFDSDGWAEHMVASRSFTASLEGLYLVDTTDGARDAGQAAVESLSLAMGAASLAQFRFHHTISMEGFTFMASANSGGVGGGNDDPAEWSAELTVSGEITPVTVV